MARNTLSAPFAALFMLISLLLPEETVSLQSAARSSVVERLTPERFLSIANGGLPVGEVNTMRTNSQMSTPLGGPWIVRLRMASCFVPSRPTGKVCSAGRSGGDETETAVTGDGPKAYELKDSRAAFCGTELPDAPLERGCQPLTELPAEVEMLQRQLTEENAVFHDFAEHIFERYDAPLMAQEEERLRQLRQDRDNDGDEEAASESDVTEGSPEELDEAVRPQVDDIPSVFRFGDFVIDSADALLAAEMVLGSAFRPMENPASMPNEPPKDSPSSFGAKGSFFARRSSSGDSAPDADTDVDGISSDPPNPKTYFKMHYRLFNAGSGSAADLVSSSAVKKAMGAVGGSRGGVSAPRWGARPPLEFTLSREANEKPFAAWFKTPASPLLFTEALRSMGEGGSLVMPPLGSLSNRRRREVYLTYLEEQLLEHIPEVQPASHLRKLKHTTDPVAVVERKRVLHPINSVRELRHSIASLAASQHHSHPIGFPDPLSTIDLDDFSDDAVMAALRKGQRPFVLQFPSLSAVDGEDLTKTEEPTTSSSGNSAVSAKDVKALLKKLHATMEPSQWSTLAAQRRLYLRAQALASHPAVFGGMRIFVSSGGDAKSMSVVEELRENGGEDSSVPQLAEAHRLHTGVTAAVLKASRALSAHKVTPEVRFAAANVSIGDLWRMVRRFGSRRGELEAPKSTLTSIETIDEEDDNNQSDGDSAAGRILQGSQLTISDYVNDPLRHLTRADQFMSHVVRSSALSIVFVLPANPPIALQAAHQMAQTVAMRYLPLRTRSKADVFYVLVPDGKKNNKKKQQGGNRQSFEALLGERLLNLANGTVPLPAALYFQSADSPGAKVFSGKKNIFLLKSKPGKGKQQLGVNDALALTKQLGSLVKKGSGKGSAFLGQMSSSQLTKMAEGASSSATAAPPKPRPSSSTDSAADSSSVVDPSAAHFPNAEGWHEVDEMKLPADPDAKKKSKKSSGGSSKAKKSFETETSKKKKDKKGEADKSKKDAAKKSETAAKKKSKKNEPKKEAREPAEPQVPLTVLESLLSTEPQRQRPSKHSRIRDLPVGWDFAGHSNKRQASPPPSGKKKTSLKEKQRAQQAKKEAKSVVEEHGGEYIEVVEESWDGE